MVDFPASYVSLPECITFRYETMGILPYLFFRQPSTCANLPIMAGQPNRPAMQHPPRNRWPYALFESGLIKFINHWFFPLDSQGRL